MADKIQIRRDTAANWSTQNPVLSQGELGAETDTNKIKMGDSTSTWSQLSYLIDTGNYATSQNLQAAIDNLVDSAPGALNTLNELAAALGDDANFATTVTSAIATKATTSTLSAVATSGSYSDLSGNPTLSAVATSGSYSDLTGKPTLSSVATSGAYADVTGTPTIPAALTDLSITDGTVGQVLTTDGSGGFTFDDTSGGGSFEAVASGTLANGDMVVINAAGTVSVAGSETTVIEAGGLGTEISVDSASSTYTATVYDSNSNKVVVMYASGSTIRAFVGTVSGKNITFGAVSIKTTGGSILEKTFRAVFDTNSNKVVVAYGEYVHGDRLVRSMVGTISGTSISFGSQAYVEPNASFYTRALALAFDSSSNKVILSYVSVASNQVRSIVGTVSGTGISFGSVTNSSASAAYDDITSVYDPDNNKVVVIYRQGSTFNSIVGTVSGTGISFGSEVQFVTGGAGEYSSVVYDTYSNKVVFIYRNASSYGRAIVGTVSGTSISFGTPVIFESGATSGYYAAIFDPSENKVVISYLYYSSPQAGRVVVGTVSGTSISFNTPVQFSSQESKEMSLAFDSNSNRSVISWKSGKSIVFKTEDTVSVGATNLTSENFVGVSDAAYSDGATATIQTAGAVDDAQSGLTAGQAYFLQEDGTLGTTADTTRVFAGVALSATELMIGKDMSSTAVVTYTDSDVATYLSGNGYDTATNIISTITDSAPGTLDTLNELAAALGDDANFASTVTSSLTLKANTSSLATVATSGAYADVTGTPTLATVATSGAYSDLTGTPAAVAPSGSFTATASGTLANGDMVVVNADGTISVVGQLASASLSRTIDNPNAYGTTSGDEFGYSVAIDGTTAIVGARREDDSGGNSSGKAYIINATTGGVLHTLNNPSPYGTSANDYFGWDVAISGNYAIVTAIFEDDASGTQAGEAYVYNVTSGALLTTIDNPDGYGTAAGDNFGYSVAIDGTTAIIGAYEEEDAGGNQSGKAYIFNITSGALLHTLDNPTDYGTSAYDKFGESVGISGNYALVGAPYEDDAGGNESGKAYIFNVTSGALVHTLDNPTPYDTSAGDNFGRKVAMSGNYAVVTAYFEDDASGDSSGKAFIYNVTSGALLHTLDNPNPHGTSFNDQFGTAVTVSGNHAIIGAKDEDDAGGNQSGKAYVYNVTSGVLLTTIDNPNVHGISDSDNFGFAMAIDGTTAIISAAYESDSGGAGSGKAYIYDISVTENLTSENFVGVSDGAYANGATATIQTVGSTDDAQSSLTAGQAYFVQADGTIATTADSTRVFAGVALSATELMIGRDMPSSDTVTLDSHGDVLLSGELQATSYNETYVALSGTTPAVDCEAGNLFSLTTSGATTFTFSNPPTTGTAYGMSIKLVAGGNHAITWPASVDWASATAPEAPASGETDMLSFITHDGGTTWYGFLAGDALA